MNTRQGKTAYQSRSAESGTSQTEQLQGQGQRYRISREQPAYGQQKPSPADKNAQGFRTQPQGGDARRANAQSGVREPNFSQRQSADSLVRVSQNREQVQNGQRSTSQPDSRRFAPQNMQTAGNAGRQPQNRTDGRRRQNPEESRGEQQKRVNERDPGLKNQRSAKKRSQERLMTPDEIVKLRSEYKKRAYLKKKQRSDAIKLFFRRTLLVFVFYVIFLTVFAAAFFINLHKHTDPQTFNYRYQLGISIDPARSVRTVKWETVYMNGTKYINFSEFADFCGFTVTGDSTERKYITESGDSVRFYLGSSLAYINGVVTRLSEVTVFKGGTLYVPMSFAENYMNGVTAEYDEKNHRITLGRNGTLDKSGLMEYEEVSFILKAQPQCESIELSSLPYSILRQTIMTQPEE